MGVELIRRLQAYPKMQRALQGLPPKVLALSSAAPAQPVELQTSNAQHVQQVVSHIEGANFTGKGDKPVVVALYKEYATRIARVLQGTLAIAAGGDGTSKSIEMPEMPQLPDVPPPPPLRLCAGQRLCKLVREAGEGNGGEGTRQLFHVGLRGPPSFDDCSQVVLPFDQGALKTLMEDVPVLRDIYASRHEEDSEERAQAIVDNAQSLRSPALIEQVNGVDRRMGLNEEWPLRRAINEFRKERDEASSSETPSDGEAARQAYARLTTLVKPRHVDTMVERAKDTLCGSKGRCMGLRSYRSKQQLVLRRADGSWLEAQVVDDGGFDWVHLVKAADGSELSLALHPWNHAPRELPHTVFETLRTWWVAKLKAEHEHIYDALSGRPLCVLKQCVPIEVVAKKGQPAPPADLRDAHGLCKWLLHRHGELCEGGTIDTPPCMLLTAGPAAGKTCLMSQIVAHTVEESVELVPILIKVQQLQRRLLDQRAAFDASWNWIDAFLKLEHATRQPEVYRMLRQALMARRALVLLECVMVSRPSGHSRAASC